jgi:isoleucyl-tRNA synthetase
LPIERYVDEKLGAKKSQMTAVEIRRICRAHAAEALKNQTRDFHRLGILGEWADPYMTMSNAYEAETARLFGQFVESGFVYKGGRPVYWCINDQTALAEAEVEYREHASPSIYVKFPFPKDQVLELERRIASAQSAIRNPQSAIEDSAIEDSAIRNPQLPIDKPVFVLIWTTTPWTLPANIGISVNPNFNYSAVDAGGEVYIVAADLVTAVAEKCGLGEAKVLATFSGALLDNLQARHAWLDRPSILMVGEHVTLGGESDAESELDVADAQKKGSGKAGTGCVHTAPGHGHDDFIIGQQYRDQLAPVYAKLGVGETEVYCPVDNGGRFTSEVEHFAGQRVFDANRVIVDFLRDSGALLFTEEYPHRYPHCWRCKRPVIFRATPQWFISMDRTDPNGRSLRGAALREIANVSWLPSWGEGRMRNMFARRPDWCVSRQRVWGVPIPVFYCNGCNASIADPAVIAHIADLFDQESADAWYERDATDLLPPGFACPKCDGSAFTKEMDILDVWFDSGSSSLAVLEIERKLPWPADVYLEGPDQYRGWFNSSLMVGLVAHDRAPYRTVITHGWTVDAEGKAMHKSDRNAVSPNKVVEQSGAEILRLWVTSADYQEDMRVSPEILKRLVDAYRKLRNTARYALGNISDFDPAVDAVPEDEMLEIDRWALAASREVARRVIDAYKRFEYTTVFHSLYNYATVTLSAVYIDVLKDRLYTFAPKSKGRRSAQSALYVIVDALARLLAPVLVFTSDEIWEALPGERPASVHLAEFAGAEAKPGDAELIERWNRLFEVRDSVQKALEEKRTAKVIGASLAASVRLRASGKLYSLLSTYTDQLADLFIVSAVKLEQGDTGGLEVVVEHAPGSKCERCWHWNETVGTDARWPGVDARCVRQIEEGWLTK